MDWNLRGCARHGHVTYAPDEADLRDDRAHDPDRARRSACHNIAVVGYLAFSKRLFGLRGGTAAHEAERHSASLLEVVTAARCPGAEP